MADHSVFSPSGAHRWMRCPGSIKLEGGRDESSAYAREGTAAHMVATAVLLGNTDPADYIGDVLDVEGHEIKVDADMAGHVADYIKLVREYQAEGTLFVERRVDFSPYIGVEDSTGTADAIIVRDNVLIVIDLKYGMGVEVDAQDNEQLQLYALGAINEYSLIYDFEEVLMVIHQPRLNKVGEFWSNVSDLEAFGVRAAEAAALSLTDDAPLVPGEKQCKFCSAKAHCPALAAEVYEVTGEMATAEDFPDLGDNMLAEALSKVELIEQWCKGIRAETERRLFSGVKVPGYKIVEGKQGNRAWNDPEAAEKMMKTTWRIKSDAMYTQALISPTAAEKLLKESQPARWEKLQPLISRAPGKPSVAPETDKRPAISLVALPEDFRSRDDEEVE